MRICFDLDGVILKQCKKKDFKNSQEISGAKNVINSLYKRGHIIVIYTSRQKLHDIILAKNQLKRIGIKYHYILGNKPTCDIFVDDKSYCHSDWKTTGIFLSQKEKEMGKVDREYRKWFKQYINDGKSKNTR